MWVSVYLDMEYSQFITSIQLKRCVHICLTSKRMGIPLINQSSEAATGTDFQ